MRGLGWAGVLACLCVPAGAAQLGLVDATVDGDTVVLARSGAQLDGNVVLHTVTTHKHEAGTERSVLDAVCEHATVSTSQAKGEPRAGLSRLVARGKVHIVVVMTTDKPQFSRRLEADCDQAEYTDKDGERRVKLLSPGGTPILVHLTDTWPPAAAGGEPVVQHLDLTGRKSVELLLAEPAVGVK